MKQQYLIFLTLLFFVIQTTHAQEWKDFEDEESINIEMRDSKYQVGEFTFEATEWQESAFEYQGEKASGIAELCIYQNGELIQELKEVKEKRFGFSDITFQFYDFNMDGHLDFRVFRDCGKSCYFDYYLFNPQTQNFELAEDWKWIRFDKINKAKKQFWDLPDGDANGGKQDLYQINGFKLDLLKTISY